jgi:hypothetical protein
MDIPNFKDIIQKLSVLRSHSSLLAPIVIGVIAIVLFIPNHLLSSKLKRQIESESVAKGGEIKSIEVIPREQLEQKAKHHSDYANDANQIALLAEQTTKRALLSYEIFPAPNDVSGLIFQRFGQAFRGDIEQMLAQAGAGDRPTDTEIDKALQRSTTTLRPGTTRRRPETAFRTSRMRSPYAGYGYGYGFGKAAQISRTIVDQICIENARSASVYALPTDISGYEFWANFQYAGKDEAVRDCWYWQVGYWIIEDVFNAIEAMNAGSESVFTSPVKRLMRVSFSTGERRRGVYTGFRKRIKKETEDKPGYVTSREDAYIIPCTGRFSDDDGDVVHFRVTVVVSADAVLPFMKELCSAKEHTFRGYFGDEPEQTFKHNQITVLESTAAAVDRDHPDHEFHRYGEDATVELDLICEYIFKKTGYDAIMPQIVKDVIKAARDANK